LDRWYLSGALLKSIGDYKRHKSRRGLSATIMRKVARARYLFWSVLTASDIDPNVTLGERLVLPHPNGVVVHGEAVIGDDCYISQQVTIGRLAAPDAPVIGSGVYIGCGAKVLGKIVVGDRAKIGANAVVLCDVPAGWTAVGVPARLIPPDSKDITPRAGTLPLEEAAAKVP
jgi:serine O-acetyltransferase